MSSQPIFHFKHMLKNLDHCMKKAAAYADHKKFDVNILASYRLAPDMFAFNKQIQSASDVAKFAAAYLSGQTPPKHEDTETTWSELHERVQKVVKYLDGFKPNDFAKMEALQVKPGWAQGKWISGEDYLQSLAIPNFYFHLMTAYAIMRHAGVDVGKLDYLGNVNLKES